MKPKTIIFFLIYTSLFLALFFWGFPIIQKRYFSKKNILIENTENKKIPNQTESEKPSENSMVNNENEKADNTSIPIEETTIHENITRYDCLNECSRFKETDKEEYCKQTCGFSSPYQETDKCLEKSDLERDYCLKTLGINNSDIATCEKIKDKNIREVCTVTVTEKIIENKQEE